MKLGVRRDPRSSPLPTRTRSRLQKGLEVGQPLPPRELRRFGLVGIREPFVCHGNRRLRRPLVDERDAQARRAVPPVEACRLARLRSPQRHRPVGEPLPFRSWAEECVEENVDGNGDRFRSVDREPVCLLVLESHPASTLVPNGDRLRPPMTSCSSMRKSTVSPCFLPRAPHRSRIENHASHFLPVASLILSSEGRSVAAANLARAARTRSRS